MRKDTSRSDPRFQVKTDTPKSGFLEEARFWLGQGLLGEEGEVTGWKVAIVAY